MLRLRHKPPNARSARVNLRAIELSFIERRFLVLSVH